MLIDFNNLFIHIPKTGGTSIGNVLSYPDHFPDKHMSARDYIGYFGKLKYHKLFKFTVVRNPWDRLVSLFEHKRKFNLQKFDSGRKTSRREYEYRCLKNGDFRRWVKNIVMRLNFSEKSVNAYYGPSNQTYMLINNKKKISVDYICRFENLEEDFRFVAKNHLKLKFEVFPHLLKTDRKPYERYYDNRTRKMVKEFFRDDIENFNYSFGDK